MIGLVGAETATELSVLHEQAFDRGWTAPDIAAILDNPATFALTIQREAIAGFIIVSVAADDAEILTLAIAPEDRRAGFGTVLVAAAAGVAQARGANAMHLEVAEDNAAARALYAKLGFVEIGRRPRYYARASGAADALVLKRNLPLLTV